MKYIRGLLCTYDYTSTDIIIDKGIHKIVFCINNGSISFWRGTNMLSSTLKGNTRGTDTSM